MTEGTPLPSRPLPSPPLPSRPLPYPPLPSPSFPLVTQRIHSPFQPTQSPSLFQIHSFQRRTRVITSLPDVGSLESARHTTASMLASRIRCAWAPTSTILPTPAGSTTTRQGATNCSLATVVHTTASPTHVVRIVLP